MDNDEIAFEIFYYRFMNYVILKDKEKCDFYYNMLNEIIMTNKKSIYILKDYNKKYLKKLVMDYKNNTFTRSFNLEIPKFIPIKIEVPDFKDELEFKKYIVSSKIIENSNLGLKLRDIEHPTTYGFIDLLYNKENEMIPCEVKFAPASHDLVTQIEKYIQHFWFKLNYGLWNKVWGITIAPSYNDFCYKELKNLDVLVLSYKIQNNFLYLEEI